MDKLKAVVGDAAIEKFRKLNEESRKEAIKSLNRNVNLKIGKFLVL